MKFLAARRERLAERGGHVEADPGGIAADENQHENRRDVRRHGHELRRDVDAHALNRELKHRDAADSKRYRMLAKKFIEKYGMDTRDYDVICGWRANASYFYIAKEFVRDNIDVDILEDLLSLGGLGIQYCIKSEAAYSNLKEITAELLAVDYTEFNDRYNQRDITARKRMRELVDSDANTVTKVFSTLFER